MIGAGPASYAAPVIDVFEDVSRLHSSASSAGFDISNGTLVVTPQQVDVGQWGQYGGQAIFSWSQDGNVLHGFSLAAEDEQYVFSISGAQKVTPPGKNDSWVYGFFYFSEGGLSAPVSYLFSEEIMFVNGAWSYDVRNAAAALFPEGAPDGLRWGVELYIASGGQPGVGYEFAQLAAIPEPGTSALCVLAGAGVLLWRRKLASANQ